MTSALDPNLVRDPVPTLLWAYAQGAFPMANSRSPASDLAWFSPDPRAILPLREADGLHIPRRLLDRARARPFLLTADLAFEEVMRQCARPRPGEHETWIDERLIRAYAALHRAGHAHSIEAWKEEGTEGHRDEGTKGHTKEGTAITAIEAHADRISRTIDGRAHVLVGGVYGVHLGAAFMAESMFHRADLGGTDASKLCLLALVRHLDARGFDLCDTQFLNPHIARFGVREIRRDDYLKRLERAIARTVPWLPFDPTPNRAPHG